MSECPEEYLDLLQSPYDESGKFSIKSMYVFLMIRKVPIMKEGVVLREENTGSAIIRKFPRSHMGKFNRSDDTVNKDYTDSLLIKDLVKRGWNILAMLHDPELETMEVENGKQSIKKRKRNTKTVK